MYEPFKDRLIKVNKEIYKNNLAKLTWGNVSVRIPGTDIVVITPSGVPVEELSKDKLVVIDLGLKVIEGKLKPSVDAIIHTTIYRNFSKIKSIVHTHSTWATAYAQAETDIPVYGTTHADTFGTTIRNIKKFNGVPSMYEASVGELIVECIKQQIEENKELEYVHGVLLRRHGVMTFGDSPEAALNYAIALEEIANMSAKTKIINPIINPINNLQLKIHYQRKNGNDKYYGQG